MTSIARARCPLLFTENETNHARLFGTANQSPYVKDGIHNAVVHGQQEAVNPAQRGTKAAPHYQVSVEAGGTQVIRLRLTRTAPGRLADPFGEFDAVVHTRQAEADAFYRGLITPLGVDGCRQRHAPGPRRHALDQAVLLF